MDNGVSDDGGRVPALTPEGGWSPLEPKRNMSVHPAIHPGPGIWVLEAGICTMENMIMVLETKIPVFKAEICVRGQDLGL